MKTRWTKPAIGERPASMEVTAYHTAKLGNTDWLKGGERGK